MVKLLTTRGRSKSAERGSAPNKRGHGRWILAYVIPGWQQPAWQVIIAQNGIAQNGIAQNGIPQNGSSCNACRGPRANCAAIDDVLVRDFSLPGSLHCDDS